MALPCKIGAKSGQDRASPMAPRRNRREGTHTRALAPRTAENQDRHRHGDQELGGKGSEVAAVEAAGRRPQQHHLPAPQAPAPAPHRKLPPLAIAIPGEGNDASIEADDRPMAAYAVTIDTDDLLDKGDPRRQVAARVGEIAVRRRQARQCQRADPRRAASAYVEPDGNASAGVPEQARVGRAGAGQQRQK
jgi:hypothetical protein